MRLENGTGSITRLGGNRRNPYVIRITIGYEIDQKSGRKKQTRKIIGYAPTKREGKKLLKDYIDKGKFDPNITFTKLFEKFSESEFMNISDSMISSHKASYKACEDLYDMIFADIKLKDLQKVIDSCGKNYPTLRKIKLTLNQMYDYAIKNEICSKNYASYIDIAKYKEKNPNKMNRDKLNVDEIAYIWEKRENKYIQTVLFMIYTGVRISEMLKLRKSDINLEEKYFHIRESKNVGSVRIVPIADKILPFVKKWYDLYPDSEYLFCTENGNKFKYRNYYDSYYTPIMEDCFLDYTPHCCRHTCISMLKYAKVNQTVIKKIVGHEGAMCLNERVYTHYDIKVILEAINKI